MFVALVFGCLSLVVAPMAQAVAFDPGTMTITPASVAAGSTGNTLTLRYTAPRTGKVSGLVAVLVPTAGAPATAFLPLPAGTNVTVHRGTCTSAVRAASLSTKAAYPGDSPGSQINTVVNCPAGHYFTLTYKNVIAPRTAQAYTFYTTVAGVPIKTQPVETVAPRSAALLTVTAPATATAGTAFSVKVTAKDTYANTASSYRGTIRFTSNDPGAPVLPAGRAFKATDKGTRTFTGLVLRTAGSQSIVAKDTVDATIAGKAIITARPVAVASHTAWAWGDNESGQLGDGTTTNRSTPVRVGADTHWATITAGGGHTVAVKTDGTLWAWGDNSYGQLGDGTTIDRHASVQVGTDTRWVSVAAGYSHTVAVKTDGTLWAWGDNWSGELGDGTTINQSSPEQVGSDTHWASVAAGLNYTVAVKTDGTLWSWGEDWYGQLGDGTTTDRWAPVQVGTDTHWASATAGASYTVAVKTDGTLWAWGDNGWGELGDGTTIDRWAPVQVGTDTHWDSVAAGWEHTVAVKTDGTLWAWGVNWSGELGDGTTINRSSPEQVGSDTHWASAAAGEDSTVAVKTDGTLWAWGDNSYGGLSGGTSTDRSMPVRVGADTHWASVAAGTGYTVALRS